VPIVSEGEEKIWVAASSLTSSYRAELVAIHAALERTLLLEGTMALFMDSLSVLQVC
jgi:ribonuclease HI